MADQFSFFKSWMALQACVVQLQKVYVLEPHKNVLPWLGSEMHPIPTLVLSVDMHMRLKIREDEHMDLLPREAVVIRPGALHQHLNSRHLGMYYTQGFLETYSDFRLVDREETFRGSANRDPLWDMFHVIMDEPDNEKRCQGLADFIQSVNGDGLNSSQNMHPAAGRMHEFIRLHAQEDISMEQIEA